MEMKAGFVMSDDRLATEKGCISAGKLRRWKRKRKREERILQ
jgi:hypothetical protein